MLKINGFYFEKSNRKNKKLMVRVNNKLIHFGNPLYQHFRDKTGIWKNLDHNDPKRRKNYLKRSKGIKLKNGDLAWLEPSSPNYHAVRILW